MGRAPCCSKVGLHRGPWTAREDTLLTKYIQAHGEGNWRSMPMKAGLLRCGKSCRLRWMNYLRPDIKRGNISPDEEDLFIRLHSLLGNRWSLIAGRLPGRTDNEIKNYWNTHLSKRLESQGRLKNRSTSHKAKTISMIKNKNKNKKRQKSTEGMDMHEIPNANNNNKNKVHLPKAIRLIISKPTSEESLNNVVEENKDGGGGSGGEGTKVGLLDLPWSSDDGSFLVDSHDIINGCDLTCQTNQITKTPTTTSTITYEDDHMLEKVYEEYWELLNKDETCNSESRSVPLDSFVESSWV